MVANIFVVLKHASFLRLLGPVSDWFHAFSALKRLFDAFHHNLGISILNMSLDMIYLSQIVELLDASILAVIGKTHEYCVSKLVIKPDRRELREGEYDVH